MGERIRAGEFEINVWEGGHPIWAELFYRGERMCQINSLEFRDLQYAVKSARRAAKRVAERMDPERIDHY